MLICSYCTREFGNPGAVAAHSQCCSLNPKRIKRQHSPKAGAQKGCTPWNKGKQTPLEVRAKLSLSRIGKPGHLHTEETKQHLSNVAKSRKLGGYVKGSGRGKKGWYKGIFCDSSWELAYVMYCLDHNINIVRNKELRQYEFDGIVRNYLPDFVVNNKIIEIKGYKTPQSIAKQRDNPDVVFLTKIELKNVFDYVISKYGKNYISYYEKE